MRCMATDNRQTSDYLAPSNASNNSDTASWLCIMAGHWRLVMQCADSAASSVQLAIVT
jgi:hypothetical protein